MTKKILVILLMLIIGFVLSVPAFSKDNDLTATSRIDTLSGNMGSDGKLYITIRLKYDKRAFWTSIRDAEKYGLVRLEGDSIQCLTSTVSNWTVKIYFKNIGTEKEPKYFVTLLEKIK